MRCFFPAAICSFPAQIEAARRDHHVKNSSRMDIDKLQQRYIVEVIPRLETYEVAEKRIQDVHAMCALVVKH